MRESSKPTRGFLKRGFAAIGAVAVMLCGLVAGTLPAAAATVVDEGASGKVGYKFSATTDSGATIDGFLGAHYRDADGYRHWCTNATLKSPRAGDPSVAAGTLGERSVHFDGFDVTPAQMAWLMNKYNSSSDPTTLAAISALVHLNFEQDHGGYGVTGFASPQRSAQVFVMDTLDSELPQVKAKALALRGEAIASGVKGYANDTVASEEHRHGTATGFYILNGANEYIDGVDVTVKFTGPAVWDETGTDTITFKTEKGDVAKAWTATGNGDVTYKWKYQDKSGSLAYLTRERSQNTVKWDDTIKDVTGDGPSWRVVYDFQPMGVSSAVKLVDDGSLRDSFTASADPGYGSGQWLTLGQVAALDSGDYDSGEFVPVKFVARAYKVAGLGLPTTSDTVPGDAKLVGEQEFTIVGPASVEAAFDVAEYGPGFYTVVWSVAKDQQGEYADFIAGDWNDGYGEPAETVSYRYEATIDTSLTMHETKRGPYLVDDMWVTGLPGDHPNFAGGMDGRFEADKREFNQTLLFFPEGSPVTDENKDNAEVIGQITTSATNGFKPSLGSTDFKVKLDENGEPLAGTYVFVTSFEGDDRLKPFTTSVEDKTEQYVIEGTPVELKTTASDTTDGDKVLEPKNPSSITDKVCDANKSLKPGTEYEITTMLYLTDGTPLTDTQGKPVTKTSKFTPKSSDECASITIEFDGSALAGKQIVVFEDVLRDGATIGTHHDLKEKDQTVEFDHQRLARTGNSGIFALAGASVGAVAAGAGLLLLRRQQ